MPKRLLYVGAGDDRSTPFPDAFEGYRVYRLDLDPSTGPDVLGDARDLVDALAESNLDHLRFDGVAIAHMLEHVTEAEGLKVLSGALEVLSPGGRIVVTVPDLIVACTRLAEDGALSIVYKASNGHPIRPVDMLYGWQWAVERGHPLMSHKWGYTAGTLMDALDAAGFVDLAVSTDGTQIRAEGVRP